MTKQTAGRARLDFAMHFSSVVCMIHVSCVSVYQTVRLDHIDRATTKRMPHCLMDLTAACSFLLVFYNNNSPKCAVLSYGLEIDGRWPVG